MQLEKSVETLTKTGMILETRLEVVELLLSQLGRVTRAKANCVGKATKTLATGCVDGKGKGSDGSSGQFIAPAPTSSSAPGRNETIEEVRNNDIVLEKLIDECLGPQSAV